MSDETVVVVEGETPPTAPATSAETTALAVEVGRTQEQASQAEQAAEAAAAAAATAVEVAASTPPANPGVTHEDLAAFKETLLGEVKGLLTSPEPPAPTPPPAPVKDDPPKSRAKQAGKKRTWAERYYNRVKETTE